MTTIYADGTFSEEAWERLSDEASVPGDGNVVVPLDRFMAEPELWLGANRPMAVEIGPGDEVKRLQPFLPRLSLVTVAFPKFSDGRGFSAARILREEYGYRGDIRASGHYILDQIPLLRRCGVSSFAIEKQEVARALQAGEWPEVTNYLQPVGSVEETPAGTRPWARRSLRTVSQAAE